MEKGRSRSNGVTIRLMREALAMREGFSAAELASRAGDNVASAQSFLNRNKESLKSVVIRGSQVGRPSNMYHLTPAGEASFRERLRRVASVSTDALFGFSEQTEVPKSSLATLVELERIVAKLESRSLPLSSEDETLEEAELFFTGASTTIRDLAEREPGSALSGALHLISIYSRFVRRIVRERIVAVEAEISAPAVQRSRLVENQFTDFRGMNPETIVTAEVVAVTRDVVIVDAGLKSEGVIPIQEFMIDGRIRVAPGDHVEVALEIVDDGFGETKFSKEKVEQVKTWKQLERAFERKETVIGIITGKAKRGFTVDIGAVRAFLPGQLIDVRPVRDVSYLMGKPLEFKVMELDKPRSNIVVSRRAVLEEAYIAERDTLLANLQEGVVLQGVVKKLVEYGAVVDIGGIDGLLHITDMAWKRIKDPAEVVTVGKLIEVKVLKYDRENRRISFGLKQLDADPWVNIKLRHHEKTRLFGKVTNITDYGAFVEIEPGVEGLVHVSEMDWTNKNVNPGKVVRVGDEIEVMILDIDGERRRISLGMKQCRPNPWEEFAQNHQKGDRVRGVIKSITDFGIFIGLDGGIDGLVHLSDLDWNEAGETAVRRYQKGQELDAVVLAIDGARERISLGVKQVQPDPLSQFIADTVKGTIVKGIVRTVDRRGAFIDLGNGVEGYILATDLGRERVEDATKLLMEGDTLESRFVGVDRKNRIVQLSVREKEIQEEDQEVSAEYSRGVSTGRTSLGDLLKEQIGGGKSH